MENSFLNPAMCHYSFARFVYFMRLWVAACGVADCCCARYIPCIEEECEAQNTGDMVERQTHEDACSGKIFERAFHGAEDCLHGNK